MTMFTKPSRVLREAVALVKRNPVGVAELDAQDAAAAAQAKADAKRKADALAKVDDALEARRDLLIDDWVDREQAALRYAAERLAREQLQRTHGVVPANVAAAFPAAVRLTASMLDSARNRVAEELPVPWDKRGRSTSQYRSDEARAAASAAGPKVLGPDGVAAVIAEREAKLQGRRRLRKREGGIIPADVA
jgi:hypothetical protein